MIIYLFDNTFEGLLTSVFDAYSRRIFPDVLLAEGEPLPLFYDESFTVISDEENRAGFGVAWRRSCLHPHCPVLHNVGWRRNRKRHRFCFAISIRQ